MELLLSYIELDQFQKHVIKVADEILRNNINDGVWTPASPGLAHLDAMHEPALTMTPLYKQLAEGNGTGNRNGNGGDTPQTPMTADCRHIPFVEFVQRDLDKLNAQRSGLDIDPMTSTMNIDCSPTHHQLHYPGMRHSDISAIAELGVTVMKTMRGIPRSEILIQMTSVATSRELPLSPEQKTLLDIKKRAHILYEKYIKVGSPFEVNIGHQIRASLKQKLEDKRKLEEDKQLGLSQLIALFDDVKKDMKRYMVHSFGRFKTGPHWQTLIAILDKDDDGRESKDGDTASRQKMSSLSAQSRTLLLFGFLREQEVGGKKEIMDVPTVCKQLVLRYLSLSV